MAKKIMFNDEYGLTQAVLDGRKTMTRRIIKCPRTFKGEWVAGFNIHRRHSDKKIVGWPCMYDADEREFDMGEILPKYKVGEVVAIAQNYRDVEQGGYPVDSRYDAFRTANWGDGEDGVLKSSAGWSNKLFVRADLMPRHIRITNIKIERLQDISDEDCLAEGVVKVTHTVPTKAPQCLISYYPCLSLKEAADKVGWGITYSTPQLAFAALIDKVSGKGTWKSNPYVFVYEFELVH